MNSFVRVNVGITEHKDLNSPAVREFNCIVCEIAEYLLKTVGIAHHSMREVISEQNLKLKSFSPRNQSNGAGGFLYTLSQRKANVVKHELPGLDLGEIENIV